MRELFRASLLLAAALLIPIIPFLLLGEGFETQVHQWFSQQFSHAARFWLTVGLLSTDIFLPIPSSAVSTYSGGVLGWPAASCASWLGMTIGALGGYLLAYWLGHRLVDRFAGKVESREMARLAEQFGPWMLMITRPLPLLAEASVLVLGATRLSFRQFLVPLLLSNLVISLIYSVLGAWSQTQHALTSAVIASITIPVALMLLFRRSFAKLMASSDSTAVDGPASP